MDARTGDVHTDMQQQLCRMQQLHRDGGAVSAELRVDRLRRLMALLEKHAEAFCASLDEDFQGRSRETSLMNDILATFGAVRHARKNVRRWMRPDRRAGVFPFNLFGARVEVRHEPKGIVGILGTWNVPLFTTLAPLASVLAAGNRALLKPSELTPRTAELLARSVSECFDSDELTVFTGGVDVASTFSQLPFDHLILTGSARTGRAVMRAAAEHLVPVTLELGGKSPVLIGRSADMRLAAQRIVLGKTMNAGQICVTPDTVHVPLEALEAFLEACVAQCRVMFLDGLADAGWTSVINAHHSQRVKSYLEELTARGTRLVYCAPDETEAGGRRLPLVLAVDPPPDTRLAQEEIFGPVLQVQTYRDMAEPIARINAADSPLALYYFGRDAAEERHVLDYTRSGGVAVNDVMLQVAAHDAPFGGVGASGMGCYQGREGFLAFSHARTVYRSGWWDPRRALDLMPPYGAKTYERLRKTLRV